MRIELVHFIHSFPGAMRTASLAVEVLAGYVGGSAKTLAFFPLDTLTTLREVGAKGGPKRRLARYYAGCGLSLLGALPYAVLFHTAFWLVEGWLAAVPAYVQQLLAAMSGSIVAALVGVPFECIKHRVQLGVAEYATPKLAVRTTLRREGLGGLYAGMGSTLARNLPYNAFHFGTFRLAADALRRLHWSGGAVDVVAGAVAGAVTALITAPIDLVNTRLQTQAMSAAVAPLSTSNFTGVGDALVRIMQEEGGPAALMQGAGVRAIHYAPSAVIFFLVYEAVKKQALTMTTRI